MKFSQAKSCLDKVIDKSRIHFYKPIQVAEVLYRARIGLKGLDLKDVESYRTVSRKWRDEKSIQIVGRVSTSSARYQDDIWNENAVPPKAIVSLSKINIKSNGVIEKYIYEKIIEKHSRIKDIFHYIKSTKPNSFNLNNIIEMFSQDAGLKRSMDKIFEITVYALFLSLTKALNVSIELRIGSNDRNLIKDFEDFSQKIFGLNQNEITRSLPAFIYRVGVTNASDRGLDMWSSFGAAIQVKHLSLTKELIDDISSDIVADRIIIVCKEAESEIIKHIFSKTGSNARVQAIITKEELENWYERCLGNDYSTTIGGSLINIFRQEYEYEFPFVGDYLERLFIERGYDKIEVKDWL